MSFLYRHVNTGFGLSFLHRRGGDSLPAAVPHPSDVRLFLACCLPGSRAPHIRVCSDYSEPMVILSLPVLPSLTLRCFSLDKLGLKWKIHASISAARLVLQNSIPKISSRRVTVAHSQSGGVTSNFFATFLGPTRPPAHRAQCLF